MSAYPTNYTSNGFPVTPTENPFDDWLDVLERGSNIGLNIFERVNAQNLLRREVNRPVNVSLGGGFNPHASQQQEKQVLLLVALGAILFIVLSNKD